MSRLWVMVAMTVLVMGGQAGSALSGSPDPSSITIEKPVHFSAADGGDAVAAAGTYRVEQATDRTLRLIPLESKESLVVQAQATTHDESIATSMALSISQHEGEHHVVLLKPDGTAFDASGSYSGVSTRAVKSPVQSRLMIQDYMLGRRQLIAGGAVVQPPTNPPPPTNPNPDLVITSAVLTPSSPTPYDFAVLHVTVANQGQTDAKLDALTPSQLAANMRHLTVQLWDSTGKPVKGWALEPTNLPLTIPAGGSQILTVSDVTLLTDVVGTLKWDVTLNSYITEANAGNNLYSMVATVRPRPVVTGPAPDLALTGCSFMPSNPTQRDNIRVATQYSNNGPVAAVMLHTASLLKWSFSPPVGGQSAWAWGPGQQVAPGAVLPFQLPLNMAAPGSYQVTVAIDPDDRVGESNEANNVVTCVLVVTP